MFIAAKQTTNLHYESLLS